MSAPESFPVNCQVVLTQKQYNVEAGTEGTVTKVVSPEVCEVSFNGVTMCVQAARLCLTDDYDFVNHKVYEEVPLTRGELIAKKVLAMKALSYTLDKLRREEEIAYKRIQDIKDTRKRLLSLEKQVNTEARKLCKSKLTDNAIITQLAETINI